MSKRIVGVAIVLLFAMIAVVTYSIFEVKTTSEIELTLDNSFKETLKKEDKRTRNEGRSEYFNRLLMDPVTQQVPPNYRVKEIGFATELSIAAKQKTNGATDIFEWTEIGPFDVGGRTRGFGIDQRNVNILIAGGVSGGIWKSINGGSTWELKSDISLSPSVSSLVQDPTNLDRWYYSTGEIDGNSASARGGGAFYSGVGLFVSNDNGETWSQIEATTDGNETTCCGRFDVVEKIVISPTTGSIFYGANLYGIYKSTNGLATQTHVLGEPGDHFYADVEVNSNGVVIAVISASFIGGPGLSDPGIYISTDDGENWTNITPNSFPVLPARSVIGIAPSNPNIFFVFNDETGNAEDLSLFRFDITNINDIQVSDRTSGIPNFGAYDDIPNKRVGDLDPQGGYNLMVEVHPTNPDAVFLGATNLFRSTDGFSTTPPVDGNGDTDPSVASTYWIGGYSTANNVSQYENHHADQHNLVFDPTNPNRAFSLHDGGISVTENILATPVVWSDIDEGYNVTQFYTVSIHPDENDPRVAGGTQDNGSPYFLFDVEDGSSNSVDPSSGDGAFNYVGDDIFLTSSQRGILLSYEYSGFNVTQFSYVYPSNATNQLFIHPVAVNPSNESYVFYPENDHLWRNDQILSLPRNTNSEGTTQGWDELNNVSVDNTHQITALEFSTSNPGNRLYFGGSDGDLAPIIKRLDDINATDGEVDISMPLAAGGGYVHDIAVNPENGNEVVVVLSNYNIESIWYSNNSGSTWSAIGGNLEGENGPSVRSAAFAPSSNGNYIFVGTSIGLFFTETPNEGNTQWTQAAENVIGNVVVADLDYRTTDDLLAVGTHGRGVFIGNIGITTSNEDDSGVPSGFVLQQNYPNPFNPGTSINFSLPVNSRVTLTVFDVAGREVARLLDNEILSSGSHDELFEASDLASGTYIYRLDAVPVSGGSVFSQTKTMTLIK